MKKIVLLFLFTLIFSALSFYAKADIRKGCTYLVNSTCNQYYADHRKELEYSFHGRYQSNNPYYEQLLCKDDFDPTVRIAYKNHVLAIEYKNGAGDFFVGWAQDDTIKQKIIFSTFFDFFYLTSNKVNVRVRLLNLDNNKVKDLDLTEKDVLKETLMTESGGSSILMAYLHIYPEKLSCGLKELIDQFIGNEFFRDTERSIIAEHKIDYRFDPERLITYNSTERYDTLKRFFQNHNSVISSIDLSKDMILQNGPLSLIVNENSLEVNYPAQEKRLSTWLPYCQEISGGYLDDSAYVLVFKRFQLYHNQKNGEYRYEIFIIDKGGEFAGVYYNFQNITKVISFGNKLIVEQKMPGPKYWDQKYEYAIISLNRTWREEGY